MEPGEVRGQGWLLFPSKHIFICSSQINITLPDEDLHEPHPQSLALNALPSLMQPGLPLQNETQKPNCLLSISSQMSELDFCIQSRTTDPHPTQSPMPLLSTSASHLSRCQLHALCCFVWPKTLWSSVLPLSLIVHAQSIRKSCGSLSRIGPDHFSLYVNPAPSGAPSLSSWSTQQTSCHLPGLPSQPSVSLPSAALVALG